MPQILDRGEGNAKRKERLARQKKGPGVFVYDGSGCDTVWHPTPVLVGKSEALLDSSGMPAIDSSGRQIFKPAGQYKRDKQGKIIMGGVPRVERVPLDVFKLRGVEFPAGVPVRVEDGQLALKLRCMGCFEEVDEAALADPDPEDLEPAGDPPSDVPAAELAPKKRGRKKKTETAYAS